MIRRMMMMRQRPSLLTTTKQASAQHDTHNDNDDDNNEKGETLTPPRWWVWGPRIFGLSILSYVILLVVPKVTQTPKPLASQIAVASLSSSSSALPEASPKAQTLESSLALFLNEHDSCRSFQNNTNTAVKQKKDESPSATSAKTLWVPSFPNSIMDDNVLKTMVSSLTGLTAPVKAYYAQSRDLKRCRATTTTTIFCTVVHPMVELSPPPTADRFTSYLAPPIVLVLRNPKTLFPAHHNGKAIKYHKQEGQVAKEDWQRFRDEYLTNLLQAWRRTIRTWAVEVTGRGKNNNNKDGNGYYQLAMVLPVEYLFHPAKGPDVTRQLNDLIQTVGYQSQFPNQKGRYHAEDPPEDRNHNGISCLWYQSAQAQLERYSINEKRMREQQQPQQKSSSSPVTMDMYDFTDRFTPGYTQQQRDLMLQEVQAMIDELEPLAVSSSSSSSTTTTVQQQGQQGHGKTPTAMETLLSVLKVYHQDIRENTFVDDNGPRQEQS